MFMCVCVLGFKGEKELKFLLQKLFKNLKEQKQGPISDMEFMDTVYHFDNPTAKSLSLNRYCNIALVKDVRLAAMSCIEGLFKVWPCVTLSGRKNGTSHHSILVSESVGQRFEKSVKEDIMHFLVASAFKIYVYGKLMFLSLLKGVGSEVMLVEEVELLLNELLNRRHQFHLGNDQLYMKLSKIEVDTMCLLLEVIQFQVTMMMALLLPWSLLLLEVVLPSQKRSSSILCLDFEF
ncbi:hypothetical protein AgCh_004507 [Apium graveolens]